MLLEQEIVVYIDHDILTREPIYHKCIKTMSQRLVLQEYDVKLKWVVGTKNKVANVLSFLHIESNPTDEI